MALKITASVVVKRSTVAAEGLDPTDLDYVAGAVRRALVTALPKTFTDDVIVTVQNVNKKGQPKADEIGIDAGDVDTRSYGF